ncbi:hypothetical protein ACVJBD_002103 [Rhizobium mongolense]
MNQNSALRFEDLTESAAQIADAAEPGARNW